MGRGGLKCQAGTQLPLRAVAQRKLRGGAINLFGCEAKWRQKGGRRGESGVRARRQTIPPPPHLLSKTHRCSTLVRRGRTERRASVRNGGEDLSLHPCETNKRSLWHFTGSEQTCGLPAIARELLCSSLLCERPRGFSLLLQTRRESSSRDLARSGLQLLATKQQGERRKIP